MDETPLQKKLRELREAREGVTTTQEPSTSPSLSDKLAEIRASRNTETASMGADYEDKSGGATSGAVEGVKDFVSNIGAVGKGAVEAFTTPGKMSEIVGEGGSAIGEMVKHPLITAKSILWDGLAVPLIGNPLELTFDSSLTPEQRYDKARETTAVVAGLLVGEGFGRAVSLIGKGKLAAGGLQKLTGAKTAEEVIDHISSISDAKTALLARDMALKARNTGLLRSAARVGATGFGAGFGQGTAMSDDPDQAFKQGVIGGMAGAFLGIGLHSVRGKTPFKGVANLALDRAKELMLPDVLKAAPGHALEDMYNGVDFVNIAAKHLPEGETHALNNIPSESVKSVPENAVVRDNGDGTKSVLIVGKGLKELGYRAGEYVHKPGDKAPDNIKQALIKAAINDYPPNEQALSDGTFLGDAKTVNDLAVNISNAMGIAKTRMALRPFGLDLSKTDSYGKWGFITTVDRDPQFKADLTPETIDHWKRTGFVPNQAVMYKGAEHQLGHVALGETHKGKVQLINMASGEKVMVDIEKISPLSGRVTQVEYKKVMDAQNQNPQSLSDAHGNMKSWFEQQVSEHFELTPEEIAKAPPMAVVRHQATPDQLDFKTKARKGTTFSFADAEGKNWSYFSPSAVSRSQMHATSEGGGNSFYVLTKLKKPLMLIGNDGDAGNSGKAAIRKLRPEFLEGQEGYSVGDVGKFKAIEYLKSKIAPEEFDVFNDEGWSGYTFWDRVGQEVARDAGYTEIVNIHNPKMLESSGNEFIKLEHPSQYKTIEITKRNHLPMDVRYYSETIKDSKFGEVVKEDPEAAIIYQRNKAALDRQDLEVATKTVNAIAEAGMTFEGTSEGNLWVVDKSGKRVFLADDLKAAQEYATKLPDSGGDNLVPGPPDRGVSMVPFDDNSSFALNAKRNAMNGARDWFNKRFSAIVPAYNYFMTLESSLGKRFFNDFFLPLQKAKARYNAEMQPMVERVNKALNHIQPLNADRRSKVAGAITTVSLEEALSEKATFLSRALNDAEKRLGKGLSEISTLEDRKYAYKYLRAEQELAENLKIASEADKIMIQDDFNRSFQPSEAQAKVIEIFKAVKRESLDTVSLNGINELADIYNHGGMTQAEYMDHHKFSKSERQAVKDIEKFYQDIAPTFGISPHSRIARYLTKVAQFDGNVPDGSIILNDRFISAKDRSFIYALTRSGENRNILTDPAAILQRYVTHGMKDKYLYPEVKTARDFLRTAYTDMDSRVATGIHQRSAQYLSEIIGSRNPADALALAKDIEAPSGAFIKTLQMMGVEEGTSAKWLRNYFKISELATQGLKPIAGIRDATTNMMYYGVRFGARALFRMMSNWNQALETGSLLKAKGTIPGLSIEFFNALDQISKGTLLDKAAEVGFNVSGQPFVYHMFHAMTYLERTKTVGEAIVDFHRDKITQKQFEKRIGLHTYDKPVVSEFYRRMRSSSNGPFEATKYLADITGREMVGVYGMANHPFFMGSKTGKFFGQHGQWPLWMLQNFGRLASQGTRSQRLATAAKIAGMAAAVNLGGRAAGFNLSSWSFDPSNAVFLGGPAAQVGLWGAFYFGSNDPSVREFAGRMLERNTQLDRSQFFLPMPAQAYNILWGIARSGQEDPAHIIGAQILGIPVDTKQYPKPASLLDEFGMEGVTDGIAEMKSSIDETAADLKESITGE